MNLLFYLTSVQKPGMFPPLEPLFAQRKVVDMCTLCKSRAVSCVNLTSLVLHISAQKQKPRHTRHWVSLHVVRSSAIHFAITIKPYLIPRSRVTVVRSLVMQHRSPPLIAAVLRLPRPALSTSNLSSPPSNFLASQPVTGTWRTRIQYRLRRSCKRRRARYSRRKCRRGRRSTLCLYSPVHFGDRTENSIL